MIRKLWKGLFNSSEAEGLSIASKEDVEHIIDMLIADKINPQVFLSNLVCCPINLLTFKYLFGIIIMNEHCRTNHSYPKRRRGHQPLGARENLSVAFGPTSANYPVGSPRSFQSRHSQATGRFPSNRSIVAGAIFGSPVIRSGERRPSPWTYSKNFSQESYGYCQYHPAYNPSQCDSLEYTQYGKSSGRQSNDCSTHMATIQSQTPLGQNIQTQQGQAVSREAVRYSWSLSESPRQSPRPLRRRKKSDSSTGTHSTVTSSETGRSCKTNSRLFPPWYNNVIRGIKHAGWNCNWRLHATAQTPGIYPISADYQYKNSIRFEPAPDCRQLWNPQTPTCSKMAKTSSSFSPAFYTYIQFLAESGRTMVFRDHVKKNSSWLVQKCQRADYNYQTIH